METKKKKEKKRIVRRLIPTGTKYVHKIGEKEGRKRETCIYNKRYIYIYIYKITR